MKYLILLSLVFLAGCNNSDSAESLGIRIGETITIQRGFYKGCTGVATGYSDYNQIDDTVTLNNVTCNGVTMNYLITEAKNVKK